MGSGGRSRDQEKAAAATAAVAEIADGMIVGLGTGSTVAFAIDALAERCRVGLAIEAAATSIGTEALARRLGIRVVEFATLSHVDLAIDGVDEIDGSMRAIKGAGGAMLREKIVAQAAGRMVAIADGGKVVDRLGAAPVPVEVLPFALAFVHRRIEAIGARPVLRLDDCAAPFTTDQGNSVLDCTFATIDDAEKLSVHLSTISGVLGHGLFIDEVDALYVGRSDGTAERIERMGQGS